jgi:hypothetical protein
MAQTQAADDPTTWFPVGDDSGTKTKTDAPPDDPRSWFPVGKEAAKTVPTGGGAAAWPTAPTVDEWGNVVGDRLPGQDVANRIFGAGLDAYNRTEPILTPYARDVYNQTWLGRNVANPLFDAWGAVKGAGAGLGAGIQAGAYEAGNVVDPRLGRDLAMGSQVLTALLPQMAGPRAGLQPPVAPEVNPLVPPAGPPGPPSPRFAREIPLAPERPAGMTDAARIDQLISADTENEAAIARAKAGEPPIDESVRAAPPDTSETAGAANTAGDVHAGEAPIGPRPAGAQATPDADIPDQTRVERARNLRVSINESAKDRAGPGLVDDTTYVEGIPERMRPERDFSPQTALDHKERYGEDAPGYREPYDKNRDERNAGMKDLLESDAGDGITLDQARKARREVAPDAFGAFDNEKPVDASGLDGTIQKVLDSPEGKRDAVARTMANVREKLYDANGNLETAPSQLYGVRKHIDDLIEKARRPMDREGTDAAVAVNQLRDLLPQVDDLIQSGADKYKAYRQAYREASQPVNQQRFLQQYQAGTKKITDGEGNLQLAKVNRMLEDIHKGLTDTKFNLAQSLTDEQIQNIVNTRNELATRTLRDEQAKVPGSPTAQLLNQAAKRGTGPLAQSVRAGAEAVAHGTGIYAHMHGLPFLNVPMGVYSATFPYRTARREARAQAKIDAGTNALKQKLLSQDPVNPLSQY